MKKLLATIGLLWLSSTALAHDIYSNLRDRDGNLCCGGEDCKPVQAKVLPMAITIYQKLVKSFPPTWHRHRLITVSTVVSTIRRLQ
jgi:hypothetical protein